MATGLFDMVTPQQAQQAYLDQFTISPQQIGQQGLLQQVVSQMGNAGAGIGAGVGRLFGGMSPQEAEAQRVQGIMSGVDMTSSEGLLSAAKRFSQVGDAARAQALVGQANEVQKAEQAKAEEARKNTQRLSLTNFISNKLGIEPEVALSLVDNKEVLNSIVNPNVKTDVVEVDDPNNPGRKIKKLVNMADGSEIANLGTSTKAASSMDTLAGSIGQLASSMAGAQAKKAAEAGGTVVGQNIAKVNSGYKSLDALSDAAEMVDKGIYSGGYGPLQEAAAKFTKGAVGDRDRLVNTEAFRAYIGNVVIPMMSQLGGSDSNEELKKMEKIVAGDTTLEAKAIKQIITSAQKAIRRDMARLEAQQEAVLEGKPLPVRPQNGEGKQGVTSSGISYTVED